MSLRARGLLLVLIALAPLLALLLLVTSLAWSRAGSPERIGIVLPVSFPDSAFVLEGHAVAS